MTKRVAVVGGGITGLVAAYHLEELGLECELLEASSELGGKIATRDIKGLPVEFGPNTLVLKDGKARELIESLGLNDAICEASELADNRFILRDAQLQTLPTGLVEFISSPILSGPGKVRLLAEPFQSSGFDKKDESVASFVERRFGREVLDYLVNPFIAGVWAGNPKQLSIRHVFEQLKQWELNFGSVLIGAVFEAFRSQLTDKTKSERKLISFEKGLGQLVSALAEATSKVNRNQRVHRIQKESDNRFHLDIQHTGGAHSSKRFDAVISTVPAPQLSQMLDPEVKGDKRPLDSVAYAPVVVVNHVFRRQDIKHSLDGFGFLVPEVERRDILGTLFPTSIFPERVENGRVLLTTFVGGQRSPKLAYEEDDRLKLKVRAELEELLGLKGSPEWAKLKRWDRAIPQYNRDYDDVLGEIERLETALPGLIVGGAVKGGPSIPDRIVSGYELAKRAKQLF